MVSTSNKATPNKKGSGSGNNNGKKKNKQRTSSGSVEPKKGKTPLLSVEPKLEHVSKTVKKKASTGNLPGALSLNDWHSPILSGYCWFMSIIYFFAFVSFYYQIRGLYGPNGVLPLKYYAASQAVKNQTLTFGDLFARNPSLVWPLADNGFTLVSALEVVTLTGVVIGALQIFVTSFRIAPYYLLMFMLYYSITSVGQTFLHFQWDTLLLETGFLAILASLNALFTNHLTLMARFAPHPRLLQWPIRWLMFRFMFSSGVVKLTSNCPLWWSLRALDVHFESQCLPTPISWWAHALPANWLHLATALTLVLEIILPFAFFLPIRSLQWVSFYTQVVFQLMIIFTGNYNFFNLLTIVLCFSLLEDDLCGCWKGKITNKCSGGGCSWLANLVTGISLAVVGYYTVHYFNITLGDNFWMGPSTKISFSYEEFNYFLSRAITLAMWMGSVTFVLVALYALYKAASFGSLSGRVIHVTSTSFWILMIGFLAVISMVPLANLDNTGSYLRTMQPTVKRWFFASQHLKIVNEYGLFRSMTGDGGRPELIIEGSNDLNAEDQWQPYHFKYKPGDLYQRPPVIVPHQPRLDWQMWFAALGNYQQNPWLLSLCYRLLTGEPTVLNLLDRHRVAFETPPKYLRISRYLYKFTSDQSSGAWWRQVSNRHAYLPVVTKETLAETLKLGTIELPKLVLNAEESTRWCFVTTLLDSIYGLLNGSCACCLQPNVVMLLSVTILIFIQIRIWSRRSM